MVAHDCHPSTQKLHVKFKTSLGFGEFQGSRALVRPDPKKGGKKEGSERGKKREKEKLGKVVHACNSNPWEIKAGRPQI